MATIFLTRSQQGVPTVVAGAAFATANVVGATIVWSQGFTTGCWLAIGTFVLVAAGAVSMRRSALQR